MLLAVYHSAKRRNHLMPRAPWFNISQSIKIDERVEMMRANRLVFDGYLRVPHPRSNLGGRVPYKPTRIHTTCGTTVMVARTVLPSSVVAAVQY